MLLRFLLFFVFCFISFDTIAQLDTYEYLGVIKLNDSSFIPYKLAFEELDGQIQGYSMADLGGKHETRSNIKGRYNAKEKVFSFAEYDIVYTKSPLGEVDMCLINFEGKMRNLEKTKAFSGNFKGLYPDKTACLDGMLIMSGSEEVIERVAKLDRKLQKSKKVPQKLKDKISAKRTLDTLTMSVVRNNENLNIFTKTNTIEISIYDFGKVDNDRINLYVDNILILKEYAIEKEKKTIPITITGAIAKVRVEAVDEGTSPPNTVKVEISDGGNLVTTSTSLRTGETAQLTFVKQ